jgi:Fe-S-cluster-containing hydrogenase component 2
MVEASFRPVMCNHCDDAPCISAAENNAISKRDDGIVIIDPDKSRGQKQIVDACPYGAIYWNDDLDIPQAWPFDAHLLDNGWQKTKLESVCPTGVFKSLKVSDDEMQRIVRDEGLETLEPRSGAKPRVYYKNNHLFETCFIGGTIVSRDQHGIEDCVEGANISALKDNTEIGTTTSDVFGEFKIDRLQPGSGTVTLKVEYPGRPATTVEAVLGESQYLGCVELPPGG